MKRMMFILLLLPVMGFSLTAEQIIDKLDDNRTFSSMYFEATMTIEKNNRTLEKEFFGYGQEGEESFFMEYTNPEDEGVKYLKIDDEMWIYFPDADDTMKISGHLLSQSMMGSDISYEDMMDNENLLDDYEPTYTGDTNINGYDCYVVELEAITDDVTYEKEIAYVHQTMYTLVEVEMYARGGRLVKKMTMDDFGTFGSRYYPQKMEIRDMRQANSVTTIEYQELTFGATIPSEVFTLQYLSR